MRTMADTTGALPDVVVKLDKKRKSHPRKAHIDLTTVSLDGASGLPQQDALSFARDNDMSDDANVRMALRLINRDCAVVQIGASVRVAVEAKTTEVCTIGHRNLPAQRHDVKFLKRSDFISLYEGIRVVAGTPTGAAATLSLGEAWLQCAWRQQFAGVVFAPNWPEQEDVLNLWRGWGVEPEPGDWSILREHIHDNICRGDATLFEWLLDWLADMVQRPLVKPGTALVFRGLKGTGKSKLAEWLSYALGCAVTVTQPEQLTGRFTGHLANRVLVVAEEATWGGDKHSVGALNMLITSPTLTLERKGVDATDMKSCHRLLIISNADWIVPATADERRYCVLDVGDGRRQDRPFFAALDDQMATGGAAAMMDELLTRDIKSDVGAAPRTAALGAQIAQGLNLVQQTFVRLAADGAIRDRQGNEVLRLAQERASEVDKATFFALIAERGGRAPSPRQIGSILRETGVTQSKPHGKPRQLYFPPWDEFTARVEASCGGIGIGTLAGDCDDA